MISCLLSAVLITAPPVLRVKVDGEGFMRFVREGHVVYLRDAILTVRSGVLTTDKGWRVTPDIQVTGEFDVSSDGTVSAGGKSVGRIVLARFAPSQAPTWKDDSYFSQGRPSLTYPSAEGAGYIRKPDEAKAPVANTPKVVADASFEVVMVNLKETVEVNGDSVTLADIASISGPEEWKKKLEQLKIDIAPAIGSSRKIDRIRIAALLKQAGFDSSNLVLNEVPIVTVKRTALQIESADFIQSAMDTLKATAGPKAVIECTSPSYGAMPVQQGTVELRAKAPQIYQNKATVTVEVFVNGSRVNSRTLSFSISGLAPVPRIGTTITLVARSGGVRIETSGRIVSVSPDGSTVEVELEDKTRLSAHMVSAGVAEVN